MTQDPAITTVWAALSQIPDPCHVLSGHDLSIVDLGLINAVTRDDSVINVSVTFTDPSCVFSYQIIMDMEDLAQSLDGVSEIRVVSDPYPLWTEDRLSDKAKTLFAHKRRLFAVDQPGASP
jgi:metal-sulfur cluster biosynthetic enzyme